MTRIHQPNEIDLFLRRIVEDKRSSRLFLPGGAVVEGRLGPPEAYRMMAFSTESAVVPPRTGASVRLEGGCDSGSYEAVTDLLGIDEMGWLVLATPTSLTLVERRMERRRAAVSGMSLSIHLRHRFYKAVLRDVSQSGMSFSLWSLPLEIKPGARLQCTLDLPLMRGIPVVVEVAALRGPVAGARIVAMPETARVALVGFVRGPAVERRLNEVSLY